jgi:hypothetical protein
MESTIKSITAHRSIAIMVLISICRAPGINDSIVSGMMRNPLETTPTKPAGQTGQC